MVWDTRASRYDLSRTGNLDLWLGGEPEPAVSIWFNLRLLVFRRSWEGLVACNPDSWYQSDPKSSVDEGEAWSEFL